MFTHLLALSTNTILSVLGFVIFIAIAIKICEWIVRFVEKFTELFNRLLDSVEDLRLTKEQRQDLSVKRERQKILTDLAHMCIHNKVDPAYWDYFVCMDNEELKFCRYVLSKGLA